MLCHTYFYNANIIISRTLVILMIHVSFADVVPLTQLCRLTSCTKCNSPHINHQCTYFLFHDLNTVSRTPSPTPTPFQI